MQWLLISTFCIRFINGLPLSDILDDDIIVPVAKSPDGQLFKLSLQDYLTSGLINRWPNNTVPYFIDPESNFTSYHKALIEHMTTIFHRYTCIKFVPWTGNQDCCVVITDGKGKMGQFAKQAVSPINIFKNPYDYGSILHYSAFAFSKNESFLRTIDTLKPADIGQRYFLSQLDVAKITHFYQCAETRTKSKMKVIRDVKEASCDFDQNFCGWTQDYKLSPDDRPSSTLNDSFSDDFDFLRLNSSTLFTEFTPTKDHTSGFGHFLLAPSYDPRDTGDRARLRSPIYQPKNNATGLICIKFYYYMNPTQSNDMAGYLRMYVVTYKSNEVGKLGATNNHTKEALIWAANNVPLGGPMWNRAIKQIKLRGRNPIQFVIEATTGEVDNSDIGIDDIEISEGKCPDLIPDF